MWDAESGNLVGALASLDEALADAAETAHRSGMAAVTPHFLAMAKARAKARDFPVLGGYVAELQMPTTGTVTWERSLSRGHFTLFGTPDDLLACVSNVEPIEGG